MQILILGAGGIGGYFGARIQASGGDVTFLVRPARARNLGSSGLRVHSPLGDLHLEPRLITSASEARSPFGAVILSCKAYDLADAIEAIAPAITPETLVLPLLNGIAHLPHLDARFGRDRVLGGVAHLSVTLAPSGEIRHLNTIHRLIIGARGAEPPTHFTALLESLAASGVELVGSEHIEASMWDKFVFLTTLAAATCILRASIGELLDTMAGERFILGLLDECIEVAGANGHTPDPTQLAVYRGMLAERGSTVAASMLRDIERNGPTESEHILGDMVRKAAAHGIAIPLLELAYSHLQAYESRREAAARRNGGVAAS